jgi:hypothetical protein
LADLDYFQFPKTKSNEPTRNLGEIADFLIRTFEIYDKVEKVWKTPNRDTLKEYLGKGDKKDNEKINRFKEGWKNVNSKDDERTFNLAHRSFLGDNE